MRNVLTRSLKLQRVSLELRKSSNVILWGTITS